MRILIGLILLIFSINIAAEDGVVIQFTIEATSYTGLDRSKYTNAVLQKLNETAEYELHNLYKVKVASTNLDKKNVNLVITLQDLSDGKPYYVGAKSLDLTIGSSRTYEHENNGSHYKINVDTSYGKLPQ